MSKMTKILGYTVVIEPNEDREGYQCFVTDKNDMYTNSLALLQDLMQFDDGPSISEHDLSVIENWAYANGYDE